MPANRQHRVDRHQDVVILIGDLSIGSDVTQLLRHVLESMRRACSARNLTRCILVLQLWRHALAAVAEGVLAGFAGVTGRCTPMGRAGMSLDLQQVTTVRQCHP
jgi:hypothetical protein